MNEHCKYCEKPRHPRADRPGKFYTMCHEHLNEYQRRKVAESYQRHADKRKAERRKRYWKDPEAARAQAKESQSRPEARERRQEYMRTYRRPWREYVGLVCEQCGFEAVDVRQMDVHHIDGDRSNNDPANLQTLCPPCHRLIPVTSRL